MTMRGAGLAVLVLALTATGARGQGTRYQVFGGGELDSTRFGYAGGSMSLSNDGLGRGLAVRASGFGGDYDYDGGPNNAEVHATFSGAEVDALWELSNRRNWVNFGVGARYVDTELSPFDPGNRRHGRQGEAIVSVDGGLVRGPWRVDYYGSYGTRLDDYIARASLTHTLGGPFRAGAEAVFEGDPTYDLQRFGPALGVQLDSRSEVFVSAGASRQSGQDVGGYVRVAIYRNF